MPKSTSIHKEPLSTNPIELEWVNANQVKLKPNQLQKQQTSGLGFIATPFPPNPQPPPPHPPTPSVMKILSIEFYLKENNHTKHNAGTTKTRAASYNKTKQKNGGSSCNS